MHDFLVRAVLFLSLGLDTLGVAIALGLGGLSGARRLRVGLSFAVTEGAMALLGFYGGKTLAQAAADVAEYVAIIVLLLVGVYAIREAVTEEEEALEAESVWRLVLLSLSVSLDELAVGFSMGLFQVPVVLAIAYIAGQAFVLTLLGTAIGRWASRALPGRAELASGLFLVCLGAFLLVEKLTGVTI